jgi:hypothetical protein
MLDLADVFAAEPQLEGFVRSDNTYAWLHALARSEGKTVRQLFDIDPDGTVWAHPRASVRLAAYLNPEMGQSMAERVLEEGL